MATCDASLHSEDKSVAPSLAGLLLTTWNNGKEVPRWGVAEIQKMSTPTTGRCSRHTADQWERGKATQQPITTLLIFFVWSTGPLLIFFGRSFLPILLCCWYFTHIALTEFNFIQWSRYLSFWNQSNAHHRLLYDMKLNIYEFDFVLHPNFLETFESVISVSLKELSCWEKLSAACQCLAERVLI